MADSPHKVREPRFWEVELCQKAEAIVGSSLEADEKILAAAHWRSGVPAITQLLLLGSLWGVLAAVIWPNAIRRGVVAVSDVSLFVIDPKRNEVIDEWALSELHQPSFSKRPILDDKLRWTTPDGDKKELSLAGDWSYLQQSLQGRLLSTE